MRLMLSLVCCCLVSAAADWVLVRTTEGTGIEAQANVRAFGNRSVLSFHSGAAPSDSNVLRSSSLISVGVVCMALLFVEQVFAHSTTAQKAVRRAAA